MSHDSRFGEQLLSTSSPAIERALWYLAIVLYGCLDTALTSLALMYPRAIETNAIAAKAYELAGVAGLLGHKSAVVLALAALWIVVSRVVDSVASRLDVPVTGLAARWVVPALTLLHGIRVVLTNVDTLLTLS